jgi:hypothetical protein
VLVEFRHRRIRLRLDRAGGVPRLDHPHPGPARIGASARGAIGDPAPPPRRGHVPGLARRPRQHRVRGAPPDGISPIDEPTYEPVGTVDWLDADEAVFVVELDGVTRIYPVQIMIWHEIVNDVIGDRPVSVTYCPLCNSGLAFDRRVGDDVLDFGTSGALHQANLVMYDRQTESLWTQFDGRAVVGTRVGDVLDTIPMTMVAWDDARGRYPDATVVARSVTDPKPYGRNPYNAYDQRTSAIPGFYRGEPDGSLAPYERVVGVERAGDAVAVTHRGLVGEGTAAITVGGSHVTVWHRAGMASPLNDPDVADGAAIGSTRAYLAEVRGAAHRVPSRRRRFRRRGDAEHLELLR